MWETMWKKISLRFVTYVIEKSISLLRVLHGSASLNQDRRGEICSQEISRANIFNCTKTVQNTEEELSLRSVPCGELNPGFSQPIFRRDFAPMRQRLIIRDVFSERRLATFPYCPWKFRYICSFVNQCTVKSFRLSKMWMGLKMPVMQAE